MNVPIKLRNEVSIPPQGYVFPFIDAEDMQLKAKLSDGIVINYTNVDDELKILDLIDYTAFEVFAHDYDIPVGECEELGGYVNYALPAMMTHEFTIRSTDASENQNVIVDFGDGTIVNLKDIIPTESSEYAYSLSHTYSSNGKYIIKIYGNTYFAIKQAQDKNKSYNNILCRALTDDLPIASHLSNFSSFCLGAKHLIYLNITNPNFNFQYSNISTMCGFCTNLISATGFGLRNKLNCSYGYLFTYCYSLETTDLQIVSALEGGGIGYIFRACKKLNIDVNSFFKYFMPFSGTTFNVNGMFTQCENIVGIVPGDKLWNNKNVNWTNTSTCFDKCSSEIRAQVPVSWGGTNQSIDNELLIEDKNYYTAFELYPNSEVIPVGEHVDLGTISAEIAANTIHKFEIRTMDVDYLQSDIVVDWGDGTIESVKNQNYIESDISEEDGEGDYTFSHDYAEALNAASVTGKKFIIKIYGKRYYNIRYNLSNKWSNLICRVIDYDLPLAPHYKNLASICDHAYRLTSVSFETIKYGYYESLYDAFKFCNNLTKAIGFGRAFLHSLFTNAFYGCTSLTYTDALLPFDAKNNSPARGMFALCENLEMDINDLIPNVMHANGKYDLLNTFSGCSKLYGTVPADKLWNNKKYQFTNTHYCFDRCSEELRAQVPVSWGGTASDDIIELTLEERILKLE